MMSVDTGSGPPDEKQTRNGRSLWRDPWWLASLPLVLFLALPLLALILSISPAQLLENLAKPQVRQAIVLSMKLICPSSYRQPWLELLC